VGVSRSGTDVLPVFNITVEFNNNNVSFPFLPNSFDQFDRYVISYSHVTLKCFLGRVIQILNHSANSISNGGTDTIPPLTMLNTLNSRALYPRHYNLNQQSCSSVAGTVRIPNVTVLGQQQLTMAII
jgi:hypothetical protein